MTDDSSHGLGHVLSLPLLGGVLATLIALTVITVEVSLFDLGDLNIYVAMGIASVKALLVLAFFMHLKYEKPILGFIVGAALLFAALFIAFTMADTVDYEHEVQPLHERIQSTP